MSRLYLDFVLIDVFCHSMIEFLFYCCLFYCWWMRFHLVRITNWLDTIRTWRVQVHHQKCVVFVPNYLLQFVDCRILFFRKFSIRLHTVVCRILIQWCELCKILNDQVMWCMFNQLFPSWGYFQTTMLFLHVQNLVIGHSVDIPVYFYRMCLILLM